MFRKLDALLDEFLKMGVPGYDCVIMKDGQEVYHRMGGYNDLENKIPVNGNERYNIYSCSKAITCTAALQLWEKGLFDLDDRLSDYLPEYAEMTVLCEDGSVKKAENPILIRHLFSMTAGFSYKRDTDAILHAVDESNGATREVIRAMAEDPLYFEPGTEWRYSLCHDVLAALVEVISGQRFGEYVKEHIFDPLDMTRSTFSLPEEEYDTICEQYRFDKELGKAVNIGKQTNSYKLGALYESGGAGGISTVSDYMKFLEGLRTEKLLKKETLDMMETDQLDDQTRPYFWHTTHGYGLGTRAPIKGVTTDFGWGSAAGMFHLVDRKNGITLFYSQHLLNSPNGTLRKRLLGPIVINALLGYEAVKAPEVDDIPTEVLSKYL